METNQVIYTLGAVLSKDILIKTVANWGGTTKGNLIFGATAKKEETVRKMVVYYSIR